jgi:hypothetical protein
MLVWTLFGLGVLLIVVGALGDRAAFERLVDAQYQTQRAEWNETGKPVGGLITRKDISFWSSGLTTSLLSIEWLFWPPPWISHDPAYARLLRRMRFFTTLLALGTLLLLAGRFLLGR